MFDAMRYTRDLIESGFSKEQANTAIKVLLEIMENKFATRDDMALIRKDIQISEMSLRSEIQRLDQKIDNLALSFNQKFESFNKNIDQKFTNQTINFNQKLNSLEDRITIRLTKVLVITMGISIAATGLIVKFI